MTHVGRAARFTPKRSRAILANAPAGRARRRTRARQSPPTTAAIADGGHSDAGAALCAEPAEGQAGASTTSLGREHALRVRGAPAGEGEGASPAWVEVSSRAAPVRLVVHRSGAFELWRKSRKGTTDALSCSGNLTLSDAALVGADSSEGFSWDVPSGETADEASSAILRWGSHATLVVHPPATPMADTEGDATPHWNRGLANGFILEKRVRSVDTDRAEIRIDTETAGQWFGGGHFMRQVWPLNKASWEVGPYYPFDHGPNGLNTLCAPHWVSSSGLLVLMDPDTPFLYVGMNGPDYGPKRKPTYRKWGTGVQNAAKVVLPLTTKESKFKAHDGVLRLQARESYKCKHVGHPLSEWDPNASGEEGALGEEAGEEGAAAVSDEGGQDIRITVALCAFPNVLDATLAALKTMPTPENIPALGFLHKPIWTTWAKYKHWVSQRKVLQFAEEIARSGVAYSVMEIDDRWQVRYGDLDFDARKFPDPKAMVDTLHGMGFKVTLWVMPFVERKSAAYSEGEAKGYFVKGSKAGFFNWWNLPPVVALDVTNPEAVDWFVQRLQRLQTLYGIDGFKFDAGEPCFLPRSFVTHRPISNPSEYTHLWVNQVAAKFGGGVSEVRTGHRSQSAGMMTRIGDRFSTWDTSNGLQSIIPTVLTSGILGYPFALPDIIGGNAYFGNKPDTELFVRWTQVNALMPAMQFSIAPWHIGRDAEKLCKHAFTLRGELKSHILELAEDAREALKPIVRPMWWLDPEDEATFDIFDQYALGDDIIVAPVVVKGQRSREVYLTDGMWEDLTSAEGARAAYEGGRWHTLDTPLHKLPCFKRVAPNKNVTA